MVLALFYSLLCQEHTWDKLEQAGFKGVPWDHVSFPFLSRPRAHGKAQVIIFVEGWFCLGHGEDKDF